MRRFTLIEIVIAIGLLVGIGGFAVVMLNGSFRMRDYLEQEDVTDRSARVALSKVTKELRSAYLTKSTTAVSTYRTVFVANDGGDRDTLYFATMAHRRMYYGSPESDQAEITLWLEESEDGDSYTMFHRESSRIDEDPDSDGTILPLATGVMKFDLDFLDASSGEWVADWDSTSTDESERLPRAVQVLLVILGPDPDDEDETIEHTYLTTVLVDMADSLSSTTSTSGTTSETSGTGTTGTGSTGTGSSGTGSSGSGSSGSGSSGSRSGSSGSGSSGTTPMLGGGQ